MLNKKVLIISGPTGSGESTITKEIIKKFPIFTRLVTATTREKRNTEKNAIDYYYFTKEKFQEEIAKGNIIEYTYIKNRGVYYGSYAPDLENKIKQGFNIIVNPDTVGAKYYKENYNAITIFIDPGSIENLRSRIRKRDLDISSEELNKRIENAELEIKNEKSFYDYIVLNEENKLSETIQNIIDILKKENYKLS